MASQELKVNIKELLSPKIINDPSRIIEILEYFDNSTPTRESALIVKKAIGIHRDPIFVFLLKKSFRLAAFKLKGAEFKVSLSGLEKLLNSKNRLDDLALAISSVKKTEAFLASDYIKAVNWKEYPTEILPCFCIFFKNFGNSLDIDDLIEMTRNPNPLVIAAAVEALKKLDTGSLRSIIAPLVKNLTPNKDSTALEKLYVSNASYDSSNISIVSKDYFIENHDLIMETLKNSTSELEITRILRLIKKYGSAEDAELAKPFLNKDMPNVVRETIKVLEKFDTEYLCVYLPKLMQDSNNKVKIAAARAFKNIDTESIERMASNSLQSFNVKQRDLGITLAMLIDFNKVREVFLNAFLKENSLDLIEKIGLVFAANPDRDLVRDLYFAHKMSKNLLVTQREGIIKLVSEKVSFALGGSPTPEELLQEAEQAYEEFKKNEGTNKNTVSNESQTNNNNSKLSKFINPIRSNIKQIHSDLKAEGALPDTSIDEYKGFINSKFRIFTELNSKAKFIILFFLAGAILWGLVIALLISKMF